MAQVRAPLEAPFNILIINNLNALLCGEKAPEYIQRKAKVYWEEYIPKQLTPLFKVSEERVGKLGNLKERISKIVFYKAQSGKYVLFSRIVEMMGLKFSKDILEDIESNHTIFQLSQIFEYTDLEDIGVRVKHMNVRKTEMLLLKFAHDFLV